MIDFVLCFTLKAKMFLNKAKITWAYKMYTMLTAIQPETHSPPMTSQVVHWANSTQGYNKSILCLLIYIDIQHRSYVLLLFKMFILVV
jgi:hypothetical protein